MSQLKLIEHHDDKSQDAIVGSLLSYDVDLTVKLTLAPNRNSDRAPKWIVFAKGAHGKPVEVGAAWERNIKDGDNAGKVMLSILLSDPAFNDLSFAAFPTGENGVWSATVERKRKKQQETEQAPAEQGAPLGADGIPF